MAFGEFEIKRYQSIAQKFIDKRRPPAHIRNELDFGFRLEGQSITILEVRPVWNNPSKKIEHPFAKFTYVKTQGVWKLYWMRASGKWEGYEPNPTSEQLEELLAVVDRDEYGCFFG